MVFFSVLQTRPVVHEVLITVFVTVTTPVTLMVLVRAAVHRDRSEGNLSEPDSSRPKN
jgi:multicomponent K+:H+ antiporter subunit G